MQLLFFWIASIIISGGISISAVFKLNKILADEGYKINSEKSKEKYIDEADNLKKSVGLTFLIPIVNFLFAMKMFLDLNYKFDTIIESYRVQGALEEMSDFEMREYKKNPTALGAICANYLYKQRIKTAIKFVVKGDFVDSTIYYDHGFGDEKELTILNVEGPLKNLSEDEQKDILLENIVKDTLIKDKKEFLKEINKESENISFTVIADSKNKNITINLNKDNFFENGVETNTDELPSNKDEGPVLRKRLK